MRKFESCMNAGFIEELEKFVLGMKSELDQHKESLKTKYSFDFDSENPLPGSKLNWIEEESRSRTSQLCTN
jgi:Cyclin-dependent kinase inhibitor